MTLLMHQVPLPPTSMRSQDDDGDVDDDDDDDVDDDDDEAVSKHSHYSYCILCQSSMCSVPCHGSWYTNFHFTMSPSILWPQTSCLTYHSTCPLRECRKFKGLC